MVQYTTEQVIAFLNSLRNVQTDSGINLVIKHIQRLDYIRHNREAAYWEAEDFSPEHGGPDDLDEHDQSSEWEPWDGGAEAILDQTEQAQQPAPREKGKAK